MNCDTTLSRFLAFTGDYGDSFRGALESLDASRIIIRRHTDLVEVDFRISPEITAEELRRRIPGDAEVQPVVEDYPALSTSGMLRKCDELIAAERYWEAHNILEDIWKRSAGFQKQVAHDIIGIVVSQIKVQMNQYETGRTVYARNVSSLKENGITEILEQLPDQFAYPVRFSTFAVLSKLESGEHQN